MRTTILLLTSFLSWAAYDARLLRRRYDQVAATATELPLEETDAKYKKQKKIQRRSSDVIPNWHRNARKPETSKCNYFSTKPRDVRFSDQRKIRRMFNNI